MEKTENKYHFARELIFELRANKSISAKVYLHYVDKLIKDEKNHSVSRHDSARIFGFGVGKHVMDVEANRNE